MLTRLLVILAIAACDSDTTAPDAAPPIDSVEPDTALPCDVGGTACASTEFCYGFSGGFVVEPERGCNAIPSTCVSAPTCDCIVAEVTNCGGELQCNQDADQFLVLCVVP